MSVYELPKGTKAIGFVFKPLLLIQKDSVSEIEWCIEYILDWSSVGSAYDMAKFRYEIYDYNASTWDTLDGDGHMFFTNDADDTVYAGNLTTQLYYVLIDTDADDYVSYDGFVKTRLNFAISPSSYESEIHYEGDGTTSHNYVSRKSAIKVVYNGLFVR